jgi:hypothetical protein
MFALERDDDRLPSLVNVTAPQIRIQISYWEAPGYSGFLQPILIWKAEYGCSAVARVGMYEELPYAHSIRIMAHCNPELKLGRWYQPVNALQKMFRRIRAAAGSSF